MFDALHDIYFGSNVAQHVIRNIVKRTTIYDGGNDAAPDSYEPYAGRLITMPTAVYARASRGDGWAANVFVDTTQRRRTERGLPRALRFSLMHELVHAMNITNGCYRRWTSYEGCETDAAGAHSPEEAFAWMIENMFRYEVSSIGRDRYDDPSGIATLPTARSTIPGLTGFEHSAVRFAEARLPRLARGLGALGPNVTPYNPFRDLDRSRAVRGLCPPRRTAFLGR